MRDLVLGLPVVVFPLIPRLGYRFGEDSRDGLETDEFQ